MHRVSFAYGRLRGLLALCVGLMSLPGAWSILIERLNGLPEECSDVPNR